MLNEGIFKKIDEKEKNFIHMWLNESNHTNA